METLRKIQSELKAPKGQFNSFGKYHYRSCEDILEAVKPLLKEHKAVIIITDEVKETGGFVYVEATAKFITDSGTFETKAQAGIDINRKGMDVAQSYGSSSSYARKYALNGLLLIDDTKDADSTNTHDKVKETPAQTPKAQPKIEKELMGLDHKKFSEAKDFIIKGGAISKIEDKYSLTKEAESYLINLLRQIEIEQP